MQFDISNVSSSCGGLVLGANLQPQFLVVGEAHCRFGNESEVVTVNSLEGVDRDRGVSHAQFGGRAKKDAEVSPPGCEISIFARRRDEAGVLREKHYKDLDVQMHDLCERLTSSVLELLDTKHGINFWVAVQVRYTHPTKVLCNFHTIVLHTGKRIVTSPVVLVRQLDSRMHIILERHTLLNLNLSGLVLDEILKTDLQVAEEIPLAVLNIRQLPFLLSQKKAIINVKNSDNRSFRYAILSARHPRKLDTERPTL